MSPSFLIKFIDIFFTILVVAIFIRVIMSWLRIDPEHPAAKIVFDVTEPILSPFRRILPQTGMIDFSPLLAMIALELLRELILFSIRSL